MYFSPKSLQIFAAFLLTLLQQLEKIDAQDMIFFPRAENKIEPPCKAYDGRNGKCRPLVRCGIYFAEIAELSRSPCKISANLQGVCCPPSHSPSKDAGEKLAHLLDQKTVNLTQITKNDQELALRSGISAAKEKDIAEDERLNRSVVIKPNTPVFWHAQLFETPNTIFDQMKKGGIFLSASQEISKKFNLSKAEIEQGLPTLRISNTFLHDSCPPEPICPEYLHRYRTIDGSCNNINKKGWGSMGQSFRRRLPPHYQDGLNEIRLALNGQSLPSPRLVSSTISSKTVNPIYQNITSLLWQWGQLINHDMQHTAINRNVDGRSISCCTPEGQFHHPRDLHPECLPVDIPQDDPFFSRFNQRCMDLIRSSVASREGCTLGPREQINMITSYLDASTVYASEDKTADKLRAFRGGQLLVTLNNNEELLPPNQSPSGCPTAEKPIEECSFDAGDTRANEQVDLSVVHTIWVRQHNKLARQLEFFNPEWDDEILYQEARRIVSAQMQHITYNEYLPIILGRQFVETYGLQPKQSGYFRGYNDEVDATITNSFSAAAFRFGHAQITGTLNGYDSAGVVQGECELSQCQFRPSLLFRKGAFDELIRGLSRQKSLKVDPHFSDQLTKKLFSFGNDFGMDLVSLNIQRGRDHGLPPYTSWQETCNLTLIKTWEDLTSVMDDQMINNLRSVYDRVDDIDLYAGGVSERPAGDSLLGPTLLCLVGDQFLSLKIGDRFFYENGYVGRKSEIGSGPEPLASFSQDQLNEIRKTTLARILCDNSDGIQKMQPLPFVTAQLANTPVSCDNDDVIPRMSLDPWQNTRIWT